MTIPGRERNAMEVYLKAILLVSITPTALGIQKLPTSLADSPQPFGQIAASVLWLGCFVSLIGMGARNRDTGVAVQRAGLVGVAIGGVLYALALALSVDLPGLLRATEWARAWDAFSPIAIAFGMSLGLGVGAIARRRQLRTYVQRRVDEAREDEAR